MFSPPFSGHLPLASSSCQQNEVKTCFPPISLSTELAAAVRFSFQGKCLLLCLGPGVEFVMVVIAHVEFEGKLRESAASSSSCGCFLFAPYGA